MTDVGVLHLQIIHSQIFHSQILHSQHLRGSGSIVGLRVKSTRPQVSQLLKGKTSQTVVELVPALFSLCGRAQGAAAEAAVAAACNMDFARHLTLERAVACEAAQEHGWRLLLDWPKVLGLAPLQADFVRWHGRLREIAVGQGDSNILQHEVESFWLGMPVADWLAMTSLSDLQRWWNTSNSAAASLFARLDTLDMASTYDSLKKLPDIRLLPDWSAQQALVSCAGKLNADFSASPTWNAVPAETGALAYHAAVPMLRNTLHERPSRVLARVLAKAYDMLQILNGNFTGRLDYTASPQSTGQQGTGLAIVKTARGVLIHHVHIVADMVQDYLVVAPTEWNFHPAGALATGLLGLQGDAGQLTQAAERQVLSLDPCVGYQLELCENRS